jgi:pimeloyl-ACP methyl ester carboxylesterase
MPEAHVNGVTLAYEADGPADGEPMLLVTGLGGQLTEWPPELVGALVDAGFRVVRPDNRDMGLSSRTDAPPPRPGDVVKALAHRRLARSDYLLSDMAADLAALLTELGAEAAHVVGVSMGGMIAQQLTIDHPDRVLSLTSVMSTTGDRRVGRISARLVPVFSASLRQPPPADREAAVRAGIEGWRAISGAHFDEVEVRALVEAALDRGRDPVGRVRQLMAIQASPDRTRALREVRAPTLVVHGLMDPLVLPSGGIATTRAVPGSRLLMFPDMGHDLPRPRRREIAEAVLRNAARAREPSPVG